MAQDKTAPDKPASTLERSEGGIRWTPSHLPTLATQSLDDVRTLNWQGANGGNTAVAEFGSFELVDDTANPVPPSDTNHGAGDTVNPAGDRNAPNPDRPDQPDTRDPALIAAEEQARTTADAYGLSVEAVRDHHGEIEYRYFVPAEGDQARRDVLRTADSTANSQLRDARRQEILRLEQLYTVDISGAGHVTTFDGTDLTTRMPTFEELSNLDAALLHGQPSQLNGDGSVMEVNFVDPPDVEGFGAVGFYSNNSINLVGLSSDNTRAQKIIEHELGHHAQDDIRRNIKNGEQLRDEHYERQGWTRNDDGDYLLQGEDGSLFLPVDDSFVRANVQGQFLDANGRVVPQMQAETLTNEQMLDRARIPHVHEPMPTEPKEHDAESQAYFRHSREFRAELYQTSPELYAEQRRFDQWQLNRFYGTDNGVSRFIRNPDGIVVPNTPENRAEINAFESELRNLPPLKDF